MLTYLHENLNIPQIEGCFCDDPTLVFGPNFAQGVGTTLGDLGLLPPGPEDSHIMILGGSVTTNRGVSSWVNSGMEPQTVTYTNTGPGMFWVAAHESFAVRPPNHITCPTDSGFRVTA